MVTVDEGAAGSKLKAVARRVRALIVDDHPMFRQALREVLAREPEFDVIVEAGSVEEAIDSLKHHSFDVAIVDLVLPGARGVTLVKHVRDAQPHCKVLALSGVDEPTQMAEMLRAGASGFALKSQLVSEIVEALRRVLGGDTSVPAGSRERIDELLMGSDAWPLEQLTHREREVFDLIVAGSSNDMVAVRLSISPRTAETHRQRLMNKLAVHTQTGLFHIARRHGLIR